MPDDTSAAHTNLCLVPAGNKTTQAQATHMQGCVVYRVECLILKRGVVEVVVGALLGKQLLVAAMVYKQGQGLRWIQL